MTKSTNLTLVFTAVALAMAASACDTADGGDDDSDDTGGSAGSGAGKGGTAGTTGGTGGTGAVDATGLLLQPAADGWMDRLDVWNDAGIQGSWYPYGDQYGDGPDDSKCTVIGEHMSSECSTITTPPPPPATGFDNTGGVMCTSGSVAQVLPCVGDLVSRCPNCSGCPDFDYSTMWGAGIGFDINADKGEDGGMKHVWDPATAMNGPYIGIEFTIDAPPLPGLRVEIPMLLTEAEAAMFQLAAGATTDSHPDGAAYWGAGPTYPNSPVVAGVNRVLWTDIRPPRMENYTFDPARMLGVQFHVPANTMSRGDYMFCISNVKLLRQ
jgi:hypothetical protein